MFGFSFLNNQLVPSFVPSHGESSDPGPTATPIRAENRELGPPGIKFFYVSNVDIFKATQREVQPQRCQSELSTNPEMVANFLKMHFCPILLYRSI